MAEKKKKAPASSKGMKVIAVFNIIVILAVLFAAAAALVILPRETVSTEENRTLTKFPEFTLSSYLSGDYTEGIAEYYDDTVPHRSDIKSIISTYILPLKGVKYGEDSIEIYGNVPAKPKQEPAATEPPVTEPAVTETTGTGTAPAETTTVPVTTLPDSNEPAAEGEISDGIVVVNGRGIMLYGGAGGMDKSYADCMANYRKELGKDINIWSMVIPTSVSFYMPENYLSLTASEKDDLDSIARLLKGVTPVDVYTPLLAHKNENIYARTDHHWSALGAFYAAQEFAKQAGVPFAPIDEYEKNTIRGYVGTLYGYTKSADLLNNPENFVYYRPKADIDGKLTVTKYDEWFTDPTEYSLLNDPTKMDKSQMYLTYGTDELITHVETGVKNGRTLVVFKDSYGNALLPFLTSSFEHIYMCDIRYFKPNAMYFCQQQKATDVLFALSIYSAVGGNQECLNRILYQW